MKKPFPWYGGKEQLAPLLLQLLPSHDVYVEVFGGSAALLFAKSPSKLEVYNDIDSGLVNFFRILRDREQVEALQHLLELTPYAREEYYECYYHWQETDNPLEMARRWFTVVSLSMNSCVGWPGWSSTRKPIQNPANAFRRRTTLLSQFVERMATVLVDNRDFEKVINAYDGQETCFYIDPPYLPGSRAFVGHYTNEMDEADHIRLLDCLSQVRGMVILSGYDSELYRDRLLSLEWEQVHRSVECSAAGRTQASGLQGKGVILASQMRTECIWLNQAAMRKRQTLFS